MQHFIAMALLLSASLAQANPALLKDYEQQARQASPAFAGFSAERDRKSVV